MLQKTLAGSPDMAQHLAEYAVGSATRLALPPQHPDSPRHNHVLIATLAGAVVEVTGPGNTWRLAGENVLWLGHAVPVHLRAITSVSAGVLVWRFTNACLPAELAKMTQKAAVLHPVYVGPRPLLAPESALILGLRSCPVSSGLRLMWSAAKLVEWLTLLWPNKDSDTPDEAVTAGAGLPMPVVKAMDFMLRHLADPIGLADIASAAGQSPAHFSRLFSECVGRSPTAHLRWLRMERAGALIRTGQANVTEATYSVGYQSLGQFSRVFSEHHGKSPRSFLPKRD